jgi:hypothetical protein
VGISNLVGSVEVLFIVGDNAELFKPAAGNTEAGESGLRDQVAAELSSPPRLNERLEAGLQYLNRLGGASKERLSPEQQQQVQQVERLFAYADAKGLNEFLQKFADNPKAAEPVMNVVVTDLAAMNIWATWNYTTTPGKIGEPQGNSQPQLPKEIGHFNISPDHDETTFELRFSTSGKPVEMRKNGMGFSGQTYIGEGGYIMPDPNPAWQIAAESERIDKDSGISSNVIESLRILRQLWISQAGSL